MHAELTGKSEESRADSSRAWRRTVASDQLTALREDGRPFSIVKKRMKNHRSRDQRSVFRVSLSLIYPWRLVAPIELNVGLKNVLQGCHGPQPDDDVPFAPWLSLPVVLPYLTHLPRRPSLDLESASLFSLYQALTPFPLSIHIRLTKYTSAP